MKHGSEVSSDPLFFQYTITRITVGNIRVNRRGVACYAPTPVLSGDMMQLWVSDRVRGFGELQAFRRSSRSVEHITAN